MFDILTRYQASIFVNLEEIVPSPETISKLLTLFRDEKFMPSTFQEIVKSGMQPRIRLLTSGNELSINFATDRIMIEKNPTDPKGKNLGAIEEFIDYVCKLFNLLLTEFKKKGSRLSLVTNGLLKEMVAEQLDDAYKKLFHPIPFYETSLPFEWKSRQAGKKDTNLKEYKEVVNIVTDINRVRGQIMVPSSIMLFDRIEVGFDINTAQEISETRFTTELIDLFFKYAITVRHEILGEVSKCLTM